MNRIIRVNQQKIARLDREIIVPMPRSRLKGSWRLTAVNAGDGRRRPLAEFPNIITNGGINRIGTASGYLGSCFVGSGNSTPVVTDTALDALIASTSTIVTSTGAAQSTPPYFGTRTNTYQFAQGAAAGNLAEIGVGPSSTNLFSRALILDGSGNPTTITVLSTEFLDATYILQMYPDATDQTGTVVINGITYNYIARCANATSGNWIPSSGGDDALFSTMTAFSGLIGAITGSPAGTGNAGSVVNASYSSGSYTLSATGTWSLGSANYTVPPGVQSLSFICGSPSNAFGAYQIQLQDGSNNGIPKTSSTVMTLTAQITWATGV